jgi:hypothetical protein
VGLKRGPLSLVSTSEELLGRKNSGSCLENRDYSCRWLQHWLHDTPLSTRVATNSADKWRSLSQYSSLADSGHGGFFYDNSTYFRARKYCGMHVYWKQEQFNQNRLSITRSYHSKWHVSVGANMHREMEELCEAVFPVRSIPRLYHEDQQDKPVSLWSSMELELGDRPIGSCRNPLPLVEGWVVGNPHCCMSSSRETDTRKRRQEPCNMEAKRSMTLGVLTRNSRVRRLSAFSSELQTVWISDSTTDTCSCSH